MNGILQYNNTKGIYDLNIQNATLSYTSDKAHLEISREKGGLKMESEMAKLNIDTFDARASIVPTTFISIKNAAQEAKQHALETVDKITKETQQLLNSTDGKETFKQLDDQRDEFPTGEFALAFLPNVGPNITYTPPSLTIDYQMDRLNFDCKIAAGNFEFTPADTDLIVEQKPRLDIVYLGEPNYVPMNYNPAPSSLDVKA